ncbi:hypothetical protein R0K17_27930, partial [Planococcus sp. SIMBA_143]
NVYTSGLTKQPNKLLTPVTVVDYNITSNKMLKFFLREFIVTLSKSSRILDNLLTSYKSNTTSLYSTSQKKINNKIIDEIILIR